MRIPIDVSAPAAAATLLALSCTAAPPPPAEAPASPTAPQTSVLHYLPLTDDTVLSYDTASEDTGERGVLMMQVHRPRDGRADLSVGGKVRRLEYTTRDVRYLEGGTLLKMPLDVGATWRGSMGLVTVTRRDVAIQTPAGSFEGCVETTEENTQATAQQRITTLFCPGVGITRLAIEVASAAELTSETATLRSFGKRVDIYELDEK